MALSLLSGWICRDPLLTTLAAAPVGEGGVARDVAIPNGLVFLEPYPSVV